MFLNTFFFDTPNLRTNPTLGIQTSTRLSPQRVPKQTLARTQTHLLGLQGVLKFVEQGCELLNMGRQNGSPISLDFFEGLELACMHACTVRSKACVVRSRAVSTWLVCVHTCRFYIGYVCVYMHELYASGSCFCAYRDKTCHQNVSNCKCAYTCMCIKMYAHGCTCSVLPNHTHVHIHKHRSSHTYTTKFFCLHTFPNKPSKKCAIQAFRHT